MKVGERAGRNFWTIPCNQRQFLEKFALEHGITSPQDWKKIRVEHVNKSGGRGLLAHYDGSLFKALSNLYSSKEFLLK